MKTFFSIALLLSTLCGTSQAAGVRKALTEEELQPKIEAALQREDFNGKLSFDELGIKTERDAGFFCDLVFNIVDVLPDFLECSCSFNFLQLQVAFSCSASVCEGDDVTTGVLPDGTCLQPSYAGDFSLLSQTLTSKICNEAISLTLTVGGGNFTVDIPKVCADIEHKRLALTEIGECAIFVGDFECGCDVCDSAQDITFDCTGATAELGDDLAAVANATCIGLSLIGGKTGEDGKIGAFVNPILLLDGVKVLGSD
jgi:hypothetical protein